ncbi:MAG: hypothetical protein ACREMA_06165 [Longimicrobiales bacterium]
MTVFTPADTICLLDYMGEGYWTTWFRGRQVETEAFRVKKTDKNVVKIAVQLKEPAATNWIEVQLDGTTKGWMMAPFGLSGTAHHYGDDVELCYPPAATHGRSGLTAKRPGLWSASRMALPAGSCADRVCSYNEWQFPGY